MAWLGILTILVLAMVTLEVIGAERNFRRTQEPSELGEAELALLDELLFGGPRQAKRR